MKGFTLIELLVVVLIIGILSAVALPQYTKAVEKSRIAETKSALRSIINGAELYGLATGSHSHVIVDFDITPPGTCSADGNSCTTKNFTYYIDEYACLANETSNIGACARACADRIGKDYSVCLGGSFYDITQLRGRFECSASDQSACTAVGAVKEGNFYFFN